MKRIAYSLLAAAAAVALATPAQAIVGGPFDNNLFYTPNVGGTYQGTISGKNFSGVMIFGTAASSVTGNGSASGWVGAYGSDGRIVSFVEGEMIVGQVTSTVNVAQREVAGVFGGSTLRSQMSWPITRLKTIKSTPSTSGGGTTTEYTYETVSYTFRDVINVTGDFEANFDKTFPSLTYAGNADVRILTADGPKEIKPPKGSQDLPTYFAPDNKEEKIKARVRGIRTSSQVPFFSTSIPPIEAPAVVGGAGE